jgi:hypothetical protein
MAPTSYATDFPMTQLPTSYQPLQARTSSLNLRGFQRDFHRQHYSKQQCSLYTNLHTTTNAPSLTSPWMSLALHSLSRQHTDHQLDSTTYGLSLLRCLRLPILPPPSSKQQAFVELPLTNMVITSSLANPITKVNSIANAIRDTIAAMFRVLAPIRSLHQFL